MLADIEDMRHLPVKVGQSRAKFNITVHMFIFRVYVFDSIIS